MIQHAQWLIPVALAASAAAQFPIQWRTDTRNAIVYAQRTGRPILFYTSPSSDDEDSEIKEAQDQTFGTWAVRAFVDQHFIAIRLPRSTANLRMLAHMGAPTAYDMYLAMVTPQGRLVGIVQPYQTTSPRLVLARLHVLLRRYYGERPPESLGRSG